MFLPEMWILKYPSTENVGRAAARGWRATRGGPLGPGEDQGSCDVLAAGNLADELSRMERKTVVERALDQMDEMFGSMRTRGQVDQD